MKTRGFEKVSIQQWVKDAKEWFCDDEELTAFALCAVKEPKRATAGSAGYDVFSPFNFTLEPGEDVKFPTGIKSYMQHGEVLKAYPRSGLGFKHYLRLANTIGVVDEDYYNNVTNEGHIWIKLRNEGTTPVKINAGEAVCQFIFMPFLLADGDSFEGEERTGGFGSTNG